jgi:hypothetical protein
MAMSSNFQTNQSLPFYPNGNVSGAVLTLTQNPCNDPFHRNLCCAEHDGETVCANWTVRARARTQGRLRTRKRARGTTRLALMARAGACLTSLAVLCVCGVWRAAAARARTPSRRAAFCTAR